MNEDPQQELRSIKQQAKVRQHAEDGWRLHTGGPSVDIAHGAVGIEEHHQQHGVGQINAAQELRRLALQGP